MHWLGDMLRRLLWMPWLLSVFMQCLLACLRRLGVLLLRLFGVLQRLQRAKKLLQALEELPGFCRELLWRLDCGRDDLTQATAEMLAALMWLEWRCLFVFERIPRAGKARLRCR